MKLTLRRIGNSLGVIIPKSTLDRWGVGEGDEIDLPESGVRTVRDSAGLSHDALDELKRRIALAVVRDFSASQIRAQIQANLHRWKSQGTWVSAFDEWLALAKDPNDGALFAAMIGRDDTAVRLRQSMPFTGLLTPDEVRRLYEEA